MQGRNLQINFISLKIKVELASHSTITLKKYNILHAPKSSNVIIILYLLKDLTTDYKSTRIFYFKNSHTYYHGNQLIWKNPIIWKSSINLENPILHLIKNFVAVGRPRLRTYCPVQIWLQEVQGFPLWDLGPVEMWSHVHYSGEEYPVFMLVQIFLAWSRTNHFFMMWKPMSQQKKMGMW